MRMKMDVSSYFYPLPAKFAKKAAGKKTLIVKGLIVTLLSILTSYIADNPMECDVFWI